MQEYPADGLLMCPVQDTPIDTIERLQRSRLPFVLFARYLPEIETDYVGADNVTGADKAVEHLISHGHERIAFIGGAPAFPATRDALGGLVSGTRKKGGGGGGSFLCVLPSNGRARDP